MKTLWTPWRMSHVLGETPSQPGCLFEPTTTARSDRDTLLLFQDQMVVVLLNRFPYANGHLLVAPRRHVACLTDLQREELLALSLMVQESARIIKRVFTPDGLNIGLNIGDSAGAGIADHLHYHLVPRWQGDHNFMTVLAEVRTIPEHILRTYERLEQEFNTLPVTQA